MPDRDFRRVLAAEGVSNLGAMLSRLAIPWLAALTLQATPLHMAALLVADLAAWVALAWLAAHQIVGDAGHVPCDVHDRTLRRTAVPNALLARAGACIRSAGQLAALAGGTLGTAIGARAVMWLLVTTHLAAAVLVAWRLSQLQHAAPEL